MTQLQDTLVDFVKVLRTADVKVSPAETLDAMEALDLVGFEDRQFLKNSLALLLSKNPEEKETYESCFEKFFTSQKMASLNHPVSNANDACRDNGDFVAEADSNGQSGGNSNGGGQGSGEGINDSDKIGRAHV